MNHEHPPHPPAHQHPTSVTAPAPAPAHHGCACGSTGGSGGPEGPEPAHGTLPTWPRIGAALCLAAGAEGAHWAQQEMLGMALGLAAIALTGLGVYRTGLQDLVRLHLGINALMAVAVTGACAIGQWPEAAMVMALYVAAERLEHAAVDKARHAIRQLLDLAPPEAQVLEPDGRSTRMPAAQVPPEALIRIAPGARVPLDGRILQGHSSVNQAPITGESQWVDKTVGDPLYAGSVNQHGELIVQVTHAAHQSLLARIVTAVEQAQARKAPLQRFVDRFAAVYTPLVFVLALALVLLAPWLLGWSWLQALYQGLALLVIACPCALVISTPVTIVSALTAAARQGILIKGGSALERARHLRAVALDKTGTLTTGTPTLVYWEALPHVQASTCAALAVHLASRSEHPVARALAHGLPDTAATSAATSWANLHALPGLGMQGEYQGTRYVLGNLRLLQRMGLATPELAMRLQAHEAQGHSITLLASATQVLAFFAVADTLRPEARSAVAQLQALGVQTIVLSGDNTATVQAIAQQAGIAHAHAQLLPEDKLQALARLQSTHGATGMVGDGINDAPALAQAHLGFAMGGAHSSGMAMETADIVLMHNDLRRIPATLQLSRQAHRVLWQNIGLALGVKAVFCGLALLGLATLWLAVLADMGVSLLVVANGMRLRYKKWIKTGSSHYAASASSSQINSC